MVSAYGKLVDGVGNGGLDGDGDGGKHKWESVLGGKGLRRGFRFRTFRECWVGWFINSFVGGGSSCPIPFFFSSGFCVGIRMGLWWG